MTATCAAVPRTFFSYLELFLFVRRRTMGDGIFVSSPLVGRDLVAFRFKTPLDWAASTRVGGTLL